MIIYLSELFFVLLNRDYIIMPYGTAMSHWKIIYRDWIDMCIA